MSCFNNVPLNTSRAFVVAKTYNGCEVFMPCFDRSKQCLDFTQDNLKRTLARQPVPDNQGPQAA